MPLIDIPTQSLPFSMASDTDYLLAEIDSITVPTVGANGIQGLPVSNVTLTLLGDVTASAGDAVDFGFGSFDIDVEIAATSELNAFATALSFWSNAGGTNSITNAGTLFGGINGMQLNGSSFSATAMTDLTNSGSIFGGDFGVHVTGHTVQMENSGSISSDDIALRLGTTSAGAVVHNMVNGTITGIGTAIEIQNAGSNSITNDGLISGDTGILVAPGSWLDLNNTGTISSTLRSLRLANEADTVTNSGTIIGDVFAETGDDSIDNDGLIDGTVFLANGADFFDNRNGTVTGDLDAGADLSNDEVRNIGGRVEGTILTGGGDDRIYSDQADVVIDAGTGNDTVFVRGDVLNVTGVEQIRMLGGSDLQARGNNGDSEQILGNIGHNLIKGRGGNDTLQGREGDDTLQGGAGDDRLEGSEGRDSLSGSWGNDSLDGGINADTLRGEGGDDTLSGGNGTDVIEPGNGRDRASGGAGADVFVYNSAAHLTGDKISDFASGSDVIDLSGIGAGSFTFIDTAAFSGGGDMELRYRLTGSGNAVVQIDTDGDGTLDSKMTLVGAGTLTIDDFIL